MTLNLSSLYTLFQPSWKLLRPALILAVAYVSLFWSFWRMVYLWLTMILATWTKESIAALRCVIRSLKSYFVMANNYLTATKELEMRLRCWMNRLWTNRFDSRYDVDQSISETILFSLFPWRYLVVIDAIWINPLRAIKILLVWPSTCL